jgi:uncharacterized protein (DUF1810 family)
MDSLLQDGKDEEAIEVAKKANLACRGAAFIAWDDAEKVAIAQDEVYQPSLHAPSRLMFARRRAFSSDPASIIAEWRTTEYREAAAAPYLDDEFVNDFFDLKGTESLTEKLGIRIESVFCPPDAKKLSSIMVDWAKHTGEKQVSDALCALLHECERERSTEHLRNVLSDFFVTLPDPWRTEAASIFAAQTLTLIRSAAVSP